MPHTHTLWILMKHDLQHLQHYHITASTYTIRLPPAPTSYASGMSAARLALIPTICRWPNDLSTPDPHAIACQPGVNTAVAMQVAAERPMDTALMAVSALATIGRVAEGTVTLRTVEGTPRFPA